MGHIQDQQYTSSTAFHVSTTNLTDLTTVEVASGEWMGGAQCIGVDWAEFCTQNFLQGNTANVHDIALYFEAIQSNYIIIGLYDIV